MSGVLPIVFASEQISRFETKLVHHPLLSVLFNTSIARTILNNYIACKFLASNKFVKLILSSESYYFVHDLICFDTVSI
jgi:uncharacterized protein VirK/YbjX